MYHLYQTKGWILGSMNVGEANRFLDIFTSELGLVSGMAQGVRRLDSKLRYGLQDYSFSKISLVKGRLFWRIVNVEKIDEFNWVYEDKKVLKMVCRVFSLIKRLIRGEEKDAVVFEDINRAIRMAGNGNSSKDALFTLEMILVFRILHKLGYVGRDERFNHLTDFSEWNAGLLEISNENRASLLRQINSSIAHSHL